MGEEERDHVVYATGSHTMEVAKKRLAGRGGWGEAHSARDDVKITYASAERSH